MQVLYNACRRDFFGLTQQHRSTTCAPSSLTKKKLSWISTTAAPWQGVHRKARSSFPGSNRTYHQCLAAWSYTLRGRPIAASCRTAFETCQLLSPPSSSPRRRRGQPRTRQQTRHQYLFHVCHLTRPKAGSRRDAMKKGTSGTSEGS